MVIKGPFYLMNLTINFVLSQKSQGERNDFCPAPRLNIDQQGLIKKARKKMGKKKAPLSRGH